jgi:hypothetical protein
MDRPKVFKYGKIEEMDDDEFEMSFWKKASDDEKFRFVEKLRETALEIQGRAKSELRLQRTIVSLQRQEG